MPATTKNILFSAIILIIGIVLGFGASKSFPAPAPESQAPPAQDTAIFRLISKDFLASPVIYQLNASLDGKLVEKSDEHIILEKDGERLKVSLGGRPATVFYDSRVIGKRPAMISLDKIELGTRIIGSGWIVGGDIAAGVAFNLMPWPSETPRP